MFNVLTNYLLGPSSTSQQISSSDDIQEKNIEQTVDADENEWILIDRDDILTGMFSATGIEEGQSCTLTNEAHTRRLTENLIEYDSVSIDQHSRLTRLRHNSWSDTDSLSIEFSDGEHKLDEIIEKAQKVQSRKERRTLKHKRVNRKNKPTGIIKGTNVKL